MFSWEEGSGEKLRQIEEKYFAFFKEELPFYSDDVLEYALDKHHKKYEITLWSLSQLDKEVDKRIKKRSHLLSLMIMRIGLFNNK